MKYIPDYIIDVHQHLWGNQKAEYADQTLDMLMAQNDANRIKESWLSCIPLDGREWTDASTNSLVLDAMRRYPGRIRGMGFVLLGADGADKVKELKDHGFWGLKVIFPLCPYDDPKNDQIWEAAISCRMPVTFHTGPVGEIPGNYRLIHPLDMFPERLYRIKCLYPELIILAAHMCNNHVADGTALAMGKNVFLDCSGGYYLKSMPKPFFDNTVYWQEVKNKIIFGVDNLFSGIANEIAHTAEWADRVGMTEEEQRLMWYGNAEKIIRRVGC